MRKVREKITERPGLCLFILIAALSLVGSEFSLQRATTFAESDPLQVSGRIVEVSLPASSDNYYRRIKLQVNRQTILSIGLNLNRLPADCSVDDVQRGATITVSGIYRNGKAAQNPGGFSEDNWFRSEGISGKLTSAQLITIKPASRYYSPLHKLDRFRLRSLKLLEESFTPKTAAGSSSVISDFRLSHEGIMQALLMGHTGAMTAYTSKALSEAGAYHLVCVSGMHLMFFLLPFRKLSAWTSMSFRLKRSLLSAVVLFPALLSGFGHGINRATLLFLLASLDSRVQRRTDKINSLALAGSALLILQPFAVRQNGFWMSFIAAGSLKCLSPKAKSRLVNDLISSLGVFLI
ncbi:MAG: ComEC family competence protein, partial [Clostridiaceae bacterium]|nr:ComEC family competence protein [Clostridiaceae bacterium]